MICPVVTYAPTAATKPIIAAQPLNFSASGVIFLDLIGVEFKETCVRLRNPWNNPSEDGVIKDGSNESEHGKSAIKHLCLLPVVVVFNYLNWRLLRKHILLAVLCCYSHVNLCEVTLQYYIAKIKFCKVLCLGLGTES